MQRVPVYAPKHTPVRSETGYVKSQSLVCNRITVSGSELHTHSPLPNFSGSTPGERAGSLLQKLSEETIETGLMKI